MNKSCTYYFICVKNAFFISENVNVCTLEEYFKCLKKLEGKEHLFIGMHMLKK